MKKLLLIYALSFFTLDSIGQSLSLNGLWSVKLDSCKSQNKTIYLPGILDDAGIGKIVQLEPSLGIASLAHLKRKVQYVGKAYYEKEFTIPKNWEGGIFILTLGRVLWRSSIKIDGIQLPVSQESLVTSHEYDLTDYIKPGRKQRIEICIDNSNLYPGINIYATQYPSLESSEMVHSYTNHTQIKWNGVIGGINIKRKPRIYVKHISINTDVAAREIKINYQIENSNYEKYNIESFVYDSNIKKRWTNDFKKSNSNGNEIDGSIIYSNGIKLWDEFGANMYKLFTVIKSRYGADTIYTTFGIRELSTKHADIFINNNRLFVRGNLECVIFPLKGYPPMKTDEWRELFKKAKSYGLNTFRFHSWCPPEQAFEAADEIGFYLQVELPHWNLKVGEDSSAFDFLRLEAKSILDRYGNHPSFLFFSMGNELEGNFKKLNDLVSELKSIDKRHLYSTTTFSFQKDITGAPQPQDDYYVTQWTKDGWIRGQGVFNNDRPNFTKDFAEPIKKIQTPIISHEIGQYSVYPDINEIKYYTGNLVPLNFISIKEDLHKKGMEYLAPSFVYASGKLASLLYKEEIEMALKTKGMDGFQLLQLQDFPGQGTALVGIANAFWKNKGFITPKEFHSFCSEVTPLIRFPKVTYTNNEVFTASVELANFYRPLLHKTIKWRIKNSKGECLATDQYAAKDYPIGNCLPVGEITFALNKVKEATQLFIEVLIDGTSYNNKWKIWVYPAEIPEQVGDVLVTSSVSEAIASLNKGGKVLLCPTPDTLKGIDGKFVPVFWSPVHFPDQPGTMGLLIKNTSNALKGFPTDDHSDWQWWDLTIKSKTLKVDGLPDKAIIVRVIDNFVRNQNLSNLFEAKVGKGKLVFCSIDISSDLTNRLQAKQLRYSLLKYMNTENFNPSAIITKEQLRSYFK